MSTRPPKGVTLFQQVFDHKKIPILTRLLAGELMALFPADTYQFQKPPPSATAEKSEPELEKDGRKALAELASLDPRFTDRPFTFPEPTRSIYPLALLPVLRPSEYLPCREYDWVARESTDRWGNVAFTTWSGEFFDEEPGRPWTPFRWAFLSEKRNVTHVYSTKRTASLLLRVAITNPRDGDGDEFDPPGPFGLEPLTESGERMRVSKIGRFAGNEPAGSITFSQPIRPAPLLQQHEAYKRTGLTLPRIPEMLTSAGDIGDVFRQNVRDAYTQFEALLAVSRRFLQTIRATKGAAASDPRAEVFRSILTSWEWEEALFVKHGMVAYSTEHAGRRFLNVVGLTDLGRLAWVHRLASELKRELVVFVPYAPGTPESEAQTQLDAPRGVGWS